MSQKYPLWVEISRFLVFSVTDCFFLTFDIRNLRISGFRFTKIDLSRSPGGLGSSYLERLEVFMGVLSIFDEKYFWWFFDAKIPIWKFWNLILGEIWHEQSQWATMEFMSKFFLHRFFWISQNLKKTLLKSPDASKVTLARCSSR